MRDIASRARALARWTRGFTLLEVLVAVAILGLGLTAILSAQMGAVTGVAHARHLSVATGLARCKMSEIEEQLRVDGYQELDESGSGACCDGDDTANMSCEWSVQKPIFPEPSFGELDLDTDLDTGGGLGAIGKLATGNAPPGDPADGISGITEGLTGGDAAGAVGGIVSMVMSMVYPDIKAMFEASTRRITVVLTWTEGTREFNVELVQWVTSPQQGQLVGELPEGEDPPRTTKAMTHRRQKRGFTLLEVMVSVGIISMIGLLIYGAFDGMNRSRKTMNHVTDRYHQGRSALARMSRELGGAFLSLHEPISGQLQPTRITAFIGNDQTPASRVDFATFANRRLARDTHESDQAEVSFFGARDPDTGNLDLVRRVQKTIDDDPEHGGVVEVLCENIESFDIQFLDPVTGEWLSTWDSTQPAAQFGRIPSQVWLRLMLADGPGGVPMKFETKSPLHVMLPLDFAIK